MATSSISFDFKGQVGLIAGAGGGMGLAIGNALIEAGADVTLIDVKPKPAEIASGPGRHLYVQGDLTDEALVKRAVADTVTRFGGLDLLANTVGVIWFGRDTSAIDMDLAVWDQVMAINLKSMVITARHAVPEMKKRSKGAMVHLSSIQSLRGDIKVQEAYGASKGAIRSLSKSLAIQFAAENIRSNCILPGFIHTPMQTRMDDPATKTKFAEFVPLRRIGTAEDIANLSLFLLSDAANFITGAEFIIDGGRTALP
ncbi:MAG: SDR family oxidoreductase [Alphaproteobacteria bacterium]|nr:SDR family oxidoreductase [Alphaproteobacteria bacterium]